MARAETQHVLVRTTKYCWMYCDYSVSGTTLSYTLGFHFDGGDAQLDNAWFNKGNTSVWSNSGRVHNYEGKDSRGEYNMTLASGTTYVSGSQSFSFGITKYNGVNLSGSFTVTGGSAPSGGYVTFNSSTWNSITATSGVSSWGGLNGQNHFAIMTGNSNGDAANITSFGGARREYYYDGTQYNSHQFVCQTGNTSATYDGSPLEIKGLLAYKIGCWFGNSQGSHSVIDNTLRYLPPAPSQFSFSDPGGAGAKQYTVNFFGSAENNHTSYDAASLTRTIRYRINGGEWVYVANGVVQSVSSITTFSVDLAAQAEVYIEAWQTYHGLNSNVSTLSFRNSNAPVDFYGSVLDLSKEVDHLYGPVVKIANLTHGVLAGNFSGVFDAILFEEMANATFLPLIRDGYTLNKVVLVRNEDSTEWTSYIRLTKDGEDPYDYYVGQNMSQVDLQVLTELWGYSIVSNPSWPSRVSNLSLSADYSVSKKIIRLYGSKDGVARKVFEDV